MYDIIAIGIAFEFGQLYDKSGDTTQAFQYFAEGNRLAQQYPAYQGINPAEFTGLVDGMNARLSVDWLATWKDKNRIPAIIIGFPRLGTTLTEQILNAHPLLQTLDEKPTLETMQAQLPSYSDALAPLNDTQAEALRTVYYDAANEFIDTGGAARTLDKKPLNIIHTVSIFPAAKLILVVRHPCDACLSYFMQSFVINSSMADFFSLEDSAGFYEKKSWDYG